MQCGMLGTWGGVGAYIARQLPFGQDPSASDRHIWQICAYVCAALTGLLLIFTLILIRRIKARAIQDWLGSFCETTSLCPRHVKSDVWRPKLVKSEISGTES